MTSFIIIQKAKSNESNFNKNPKWFFILFSIKRIVMNKKEP